MKPSVPKNETKSCPYCRGPGPFSREHIFPEWLCRIRGPRGDNVSYSAAFPDKAIRSDLAIKDVCESCNNGVLSKLDEYAKHVLELALDAANAGGSVNLSAVHDRLLRWVLKVAFNSARATGATEARHFLPLVPFITGKADHPPTRIDLFVAVVGQVRATAREREAGSGETLETGNDKIGYQECFGNDVELAPVLSVGPLILQVLVWPPEADRARRRRTTNPLRTKMNFEQVSESGETIRIEPSRLDARTWMFEVTMFRPDIKVEGRNR